MHDFPNNDPVGFQSLGLGVVPREMQPWNLRTMYSWNLGALQSWNPRMGLYKPGAEVSKMKPSQPFAVTVDFNSVETLQHGSIDF